MAEFNTFLPLVLKFEGGFVNDPDDPGGATNKGVTLETFSGCAQSLLGVEPTLENLKSLTDDQAGLIYRSLYWDKIHGDEFVNQNLANIVCDFYVNAKANAAKLLQSVANEMGANLKVDGGIGSSTMAAIAALDQDELYRRYRAGRIAYYRNLAASRPSLAKFLNGWLNRVNAFPDA
jgi:lysozyme family protein